MYCIVAYFCMNACFVTCTYITRKRAQIPAQERLCAEWDLAEIAIGTSKVCDVPFLHHPGLGAASVVIIGYVATKKKMRASAATFDVSEECGGHAEITIYKFGDANTNSRQVRGHVGGLVVRVLRSCGKHLTNLGVSVVQDTAIEDDEALRGADVALLVADRDYLDPAADSAEGYCAGALEYLERQQPSMLLGRKEKLLDRWAGMYQARFPTLPALEPPAWVDFVPGGYQDAVYQELLKDPQERRIIYLWGDTGIGKSTLTRQLSEPDWWHALGKPFPRFVKCNTISSMHHFLQVYEGERIMSFNFEFGDIPRMRPEQSNFLLECTDQCEQVSQKCQGHRKFVAGHVIVMANEQPPAGWLHKEIWLLRLVKNAHLSPETTWHFPGEAPRTRGTVGKVGDVAKPWKLGDADPLKHGHAQILQDWQLESKAVFTMNDIPTPKRRRISEALSPDSRDAVNALLRRASLS